MASTKKNQESLRPAIKFKTVTGELVDYMPPKTSEDLQRYCQQFFGLTIADRAVCKGHCSPLDALSAAYFAERPLIIWKASRGLAGKSTSLAALSILELLMGADVVLLGGSLQQSKRVHDVETAVWNHTINIGGKEVEGPFKSLLSEEPTSMFTKTKKGNWLKAVTASQKSARGEHPQRLRIDEVDEVDIDILDAALGQPMPYNGIVDQVVLSSTHQYANGTMTEVLARAKEKKYPVFEWCIARGTLVSTPYGRQPIETLKKGDLVYSLKGKDVVAVPVKDAWKTGIKKTLIITGSGGESVTCTPDHKILTMYGWRRADEIKQGDILFGLQRETRDPNGARREEQNRCSKSNEKEFLPGLRMPDSTQVKSLQGVLPKNNDETEQSSGGGYGRATSTKNMAFQGIKTGAARQGIIQRIRTILPESSSVREMGNRLSDCAARAIRGRIRLASHTASGVGAGQEESRHVNRIGEEAFSSVGWRTASLVRADKISPGPIVEVWDISVPETHNFIAGGIVVHNCWRETHVNNGGWLTEEALTRAKERMTERMFRIECELGEPSIEGRILSEETIKKVFGDARSKSVSDSLGRTYRFEPSVPGAKYCTGCDWARDKDFFALATIRYDCVPAKVVAYERTQKEDWPILIAKAEARAREYPGLLVHDGLQQGSVLQSYLSVDSYPFEARGDRRYQLYGDYIIGMENGLIKIPKIESLKKEHEYVTQEDLYTTGGHPPDGLCACGLAWQGVLGKACDVLKFRPAHFGRPIMF